MVIFISGATHTGKTNLAQKLMEKTKYPYVSQDHIKMGLIRSGYTDLTPEDDDKLTDYLWPVTREMAKTAIENRQNLIIEGCYIPFDWKKDFEPEYSEQIRYINICFSDEYIDNHFDDICRYGSCIESRLDDGYCTPEVLLRDNRRFRKNCEYNGLDYLLVTENYTETIEEIVENF